MKYEIACTALNMKFNFLTQFRPEISIFQLLQPIFRKIREYNKSSFPENECFSLSYSYNYYENKMWKETGQETNKLPSTVSARTWRRHSALLSLWQEQRK